MTFRRDLLLAMGILVAMVALVSLGAIGLFSRMTPAIERILEENVFSIGASEEMLAILAQTKASFLREEDRETFERALDHAKANVTEDSERLALQRIQNHWSAAADGKPLHIQTMVREIRTLSAINRKAMESADRRARRLGEAGGWAAVLIAIVALAIGIITMRRTDQRILRVFCEIYDVLRAVRKGDRQRRCQHVETAQELREILDGINLLLDERMQRSDHVDS